MDFSLDDEVNKATPIKLTSDVDNVATPQPIESSDQQVAQTSAMSDTVNEVVDVEPTIKNNTGAFDIIRPKPPLVTEQSIVHDTQPPIVPEPPVNQEMPSSTIQPVEPISPLNTQQTESIAIMNDVIASEPVATKLESSDIENIDFQKEETEMTLPVPEMLEAQMLTQSTPENPQSAPVPTESLIPEALQMEDESQVSMPKEISELKNNENVNAIPAMSETSMDLKPKKNNNKLLIIITVVIAAAIIISGLVLIFLRTKDATTTTNEPVVGSQTETSVTENQTVPETTQSTDTTKLKSDLKSVNTQTDFADDIGDSNLGL